MIQLEVRKGGLPRGSAKFKQRGQAYLPDLFISY